MDVFGKARTKRPGSRQALESARVKLFFSPPALTASQHRLDLAALLRPFPVLPDFVPSVPASQAALVARSYLAWASDRVEALPVLTVHGGTGIRVSICLPLIKLDNVEARGSALIFAMKTRANFNRADGNPEAEAFRKMFLQEVMEEADQGFCAELIVGKENRDGQPQLIWKKPEINLALEVVRQIEQAYQPGLSF